MPLALAKVEAPPQQQEGVPVMEQPMRPKDQRIVVWELKRREIERLPMLGTHEGAESEVPD